MNITQPNADVFRAVSDPTRRAILDLLEEGEKTVTELTQPFPISQPALSQHLSVLKRAGVVTVRRDGRFSFYQLNPVPLKVIYDWVGHYERFWRQRLDRLGDYLEKRK
jgi:DNA-binding transcriptional ArsR family regulator